MADSPDQNPYSHYFQSSEGQPTETASRSSSRLGIPERTPSRTASPTQYEFIMTTGDESAAAAKRKLKTVRSHVMKNYLQQQQRQGHSGDSSLSVATGDRRKGKQRARSSRSASREAERSPISPAVSEGARSAVAELGSLFSGLSSYSPYTGKGADEQARSINKQAFALDFAWDAPRDEASIFAEAYVGSLIRDKMGGLLEPSFETLNAQGETMRIIKDTLGVAGNDVPQSIIFAVSLLAFGCSIDGDWDQARGHVEALQRIIDSCGGVHTLDFELQRTVTWTAYRVSAALRLPPIFPIPRFLNVGPSPLAFLDDAQIRAWRTVKRFPKDSSFVFDIVVRLHQLGLATSAEWYGEMDQRALSNMYFEALECTVVAQLDEPWSATIAAGAQRQEAATMFKIWAAGLPVFVCGTIRHVRSRLGMIIVERRICDPLLARVRDLLDSLGGYHAWPRGKNLEPVLATLFYCVESCESIDAWRPWCMDALRKVVEMLKIKSVDEFKKVLDHFPSTNEYRNAADEIWREMTQGGSAASTPSLTFSTLQ